MSKLRRQLSSSTSNMAETKNLTDIKNKTGNLYESIAIIAKRANQINITLKEELHNKLEEFASHTDSLEEIHENKEQIEISRAMKECQILHYWPRRNSWKTRSIIERMKTIYLPDYFIERC